MNPQNENKTTTKIKTVLFKEKERETTHRIIVLG
jgi:hypothetical protein